MDETFHFHGGNSPILISMPHVGTALPNELKSRLTTNAQNLPDVDWHLPLLYSIVEKYDISVLHAEFARNVIDLNRPPENTSLYPGQDVTGLCPIDTFSKELIYLKNMQPNEQEVQERIKQYWQPYHKKIKAELERIHSIHGIAILWDAHSIASHVPRFFDGKLPDLNFGTANISSCNISLQEAIEKTMIQSDNAVNYSYVFNGRFKGGYITRHYGAPEKNIHAIQLEMSQSIYMEEKPPYKYDEALALKLKPLLSDLIETCLKWANKNK
ncbi:MAG TPA: N-formylglutamate deformylase [Methylotenera sp.]|nr:N-formylglutamate deformylase [Methylotenera sp.]HPH06536.1 N-formylglutamate deformylase [Methylotenera sp.]HPN01794.1 N-formylglutamate deformylase [Methylotenera sp.]